MFCKNDKSSIETQILSTLVSLYPYIEKPLRDITPIIFYYRGKTLELGVHAEEEFESFTKQKHVSLQSLDFMP